MSEKRSSTEPNDRSQWKGKPPLYHIRSVWLGSWIQLWFQIIQPPKGEGVKREAEERHVFIGSRTNNEFIFLFCL